MKKLINKISFIVILILAPNIAFADNQSVNNKKLSDFIQIRQTAVDKNKIGEPAQILFTLPSNGANSYVIDGALTINLIPVLPLEIQPEVEVLGPVIEYHKNNLIAKETDTLKAGIKSSGILGDISTGWAHVYNLNFTYKNNNVDKAESFEVIGRYTPLVNVLRIDQIKGNDYIKASWRPTVGIENDNIFSAAKKDAATGSIVRLLGELNIDIYPFPAATNYQLIISVTGDYWYNISKSKGIADGKYHYYLFNPSVVYYVNSEQNVGFGIDYMNGENPSDGTLLQKYWQFGLKIKF